MPIETRNCTLTEEQVKAIAKGLARIGAEQAKVIVTNDLQGAIRAHPGSDTAYAEYSVDRGGGQVAAKVMSSGSEAAIYVDHELFTGASLEANERLLAHEGGHIVTHHRNEEFTSLHYLAPTQEEYDLLASVAISIEEYRIERELADMGYDEAGIGHVESMGWTLYTTSWDLLKALIDPNSNPEILRRTISAKLADLVKILGYAAGPLIAKHNGVFPTERMTAAELSNWDDYVGEDWERLVEIYSRIPGIATPMSAEDMTARLSEAFSWYRLWMGRVGFTQTRDDQGGLWFIRTGSDELWNARLERVKAEAQIRASQET